MNFVRTSLATIVAATIALAGCAVSTGDASQSSDEALWKCSDQGCTPPHSIQCNPKTMCCYEGGEGMSFSTCGKQLATAGCMGGDDRQPAFASAVQTTGPGHWWFQVWCPPSALSVANSIACTSAGIHWNFAGNPCSNPRPASYPTNWVNVEYDPNCGGNCNTISAF